MRKYLVVTLLLLSPFVASAQVGMQKYGGAGNQYGYRIKPTKDGGFIVAGANDATGQKNGDYWVVRFDRKGQVMWDSAYGNPDVDFLWSVEPTKDNGALLAGYSGVQNSGTEEALMYKIDSVGKVVKKLEVNFAKSDHAHWFKQIRDGHYYWAGHTDSEGDPNGDMILQKLDSNFKLVWQKTYDNGSAEHCHTAAITADDGCILLGHTTINNREKFFAVRVDTSGKVIWKKSYSSDPSNNDSPYDVAVTREGDYAFFGYSGDYYTVSSMWLLVVDTNGTVKIDKHYNTDVCSIFGGIQSSDSGYVISGYSVLPGSANSHLYVVKTDKTGALEWQKTYGDSAWAYDVMQRGKQFIVAGGTDQTADHQDDLWIVVLDSAGNPAPLAPLPEDTTKETVRSREIPGVFLSQNYPNPFSASTTISFSLDRSQHVTLEIFNDLGEKISTLIDRTEEVGNHYIRFNAKDLPSGKYLCKLTTAAGSQFNEMVVGK
ncbi:MAG: T9SS type A sorting domain-containing protein [Bacteroidota bacterium]|nr:T9SS type A sorting domain-containing protein [Bacteroidota bacterium]MDP4230718.1 T9SS type A sorting domain-containing protein [Bacteroidota bacterium]MDP4237538.1 T9SS type A sorting domain-containing protein [Bacteroidota bacterium]